VPARFPLCGRRRHYGCRRRPFTRAGGSSWRQEPAFAARYVSGRRPNCSSAGCGMADAGPWQRRSVCDRKGAQHAYCRSAPRRPTAPSREVCGLSPTDVAFARSEAMQMRAGVRKGRDERFRKSGQELPDEGQAFQFTSEALDAEGCLVPRRRFGRGGFPRRRRRNIDRRAYDGDVREPLLTERVPRQCPPWRSLPPWFDNHQVTAGPCGAGMFRLAPEESTLTEVSARGTRSKSELLAEYGHPDWTVWHGGGGAPEV